MQTIPLSREELTQKAKDESDRADLKQHADKLILGFENSSPTDSKRALWELIQNARDLSDRTIIEVTVDSSQFSFTHHGKPFDSNTLLCLVKQVSSKTRKKKEQKADADEVKEVGQYGTGFITTHSFGKRFLIDGTMELQIGQYIALEAFEIDRVAGDSDELTGKLLEQQKAVFRLVEIGALTTTPLPTTFRYQFALPVEVKNAKIALAENTAYFIPPVMALNRNIYSISVTNQLTQPSTSYTYKKGDSYTEKEMTVIPVQKDDDPPLRLFILQVDQELDLKIILPLKDASTALLLPDTMSRLFLYFPLIGTEQFGCNFIIHCGLFNPHEKRDGIWLASDNPQNKEKEASNQAIIKKASEAIFSFLEANAAVISNPIYLAPVAFQVASHNEFLDNYFRELKTTWVSKFQTYPLVEAAQKRLTPGETYFLAEELVQEEMAADSIYELVALFWKNIPSKTLSVQWTAIVKVWDDKRTKWISIKDICGKIQESMPGSIDTEILQEFYRYLLRNNHHKYFDDFRLLPTYNKKYAFKTGLHKSAPLHALFIEMARTFAPKVPDQLVQDDFILQHSFKDYTRSELSKQLNPVLKALSSQLKVGSLLPEASKILLIKFCNSFPSLENRGARGELMQVVKPFYGVEAEFLHIPNAGEDRIDYFVATECLIRQLIFDFATRASKEKGWVSTNLSTIKQLLVVLSTTREFAELLPSMPVFVNRNHALITRETALIQKDIPEELKTLYYSIFRKDKNDVLLLEDFVPFLKDGKILEGKQVALEIAAYIDGHGDIEKINQHPDAKLILDIIKRISDPQQKDEWSKFFPAIAAARTTIVTARVVKEEVKENIFAILTLEDDSKIALLGDLARDEEMTVIIDYGRQKLLEEKAKVFDFDLKHKIGKHIEGLLREHMRGDLHQKHLCVDVEDEQRGKDIAIRKGEDILFYIEVKSRWRKDYSIRMSKTQSEAAVLNPTVYALLGVDMVDYAPADGNRHEPVELSCITNRILALDKIGERIAPLIEISMKKSQVEEDLHFSPDYTIVVPQAVFKREGIEFDQFMANLITYLEQAVNG